MPNAVSLPFPVTLRASDDGAPTELRIQVAARGPLEAPGREWIERAISSFVTAASGGMFLPSGSIPVRQSAYRVAHTATDVIWEGRTRGATLAAYKTFIGVMCFGARYAVPVKQVAIVSVGGAGRPLSLETVLAPSNEPRLPTSLPFPVVREEPERYDKNRKVHVEFAAPPHTDQFAAAAKAVAAWDTLCLGGFPPNDQAPEESGIAPGEIYLVDAYTLEHPIPLFEASEAAFNAIVNYAASLHGRGTAIRGVVIA